MSRWRVFALALAAISLAAGSAAAAVRERVVIWNMAMCPMLWAVMAVPDGWVEDLSAACDSRLAVLVPKGTTLGSGPAAIYARATPNSDNVSLDDFARNSQARWLKSVPDSKIAPIGEVARANGHTAFKLFRYDNSSRPDQATELSAFTLDPRRRR